MTAWLAYAICLAIAAPLVYLLTRYWSGWNAPSIHVERKSLKDCAFDEGTPDQPVGYAEGE